MRVTDVSQKRQLYLRMDAIDARLQELGARVTPIVSLRKNRQALLSEEEKAEATELTEEKKRIQKALRNSQAAN